MLSQELKEKYGSTMTPNDVAAELHQHPSHIRVMCSQGILPAVRIGKRWRIPTEKFALVLERSHE